MTDDTEVEFEASEPSTLEAQLAAAQQSASSKTPVIEYLFQKLETSNSKIVYHDDLREAINWRNAQIEQENADAATAGGKRTKKKKKLSTSNLANFLKDVIRTPRGNDWWPNAAKAKRFTGRQRYGENMVMQFVPYEEGQEIPFPDHFVPEAGTPIHDIQSASIPHLARMLGRKEETWLTQVVVNLRILETQMSVHSPLRMKLRDITHLQMGMKGQPEIDATFVMTLRDGKAGEDANVFITCEAKQLGERLLEDQIRTQVERAMTETASFGHPPVHSVKPVSVQVWERDKERFIFVVEFEEFERATFDKVWKNLKSPPDDERLFRMPLKEASKALYRLCPPIPGINA